MCCCRFKKTETPSGSNTGSTGVPSVPGGKPDGACESTSRV